VNPGEGADSTTKPSAGTQQRRVCLLTGASGQLGTYFCRHFVDRYDIVAVYRRNRPAFAARDARYFDPMDPCLEVEGNQGEIFLIQADLTDERECNRVVELALARYDRIDLLVNGAVASVWSSMINSDYLRRSGYNQFVTNVLVPLNLSISVARQFWQGRDVENRANNRNVVNVSSIAGLRIYAGSGQSLYAASKAALNHLTGHMANEFAPLGVRVNATAANSFPSIVPTSRAAEAIVRLDSGAENSVIVVVDGEEDTDIQLSPFVAKRG
jgi:NAD(P)-dependent dehydrogenase (short-subunit alcohol dehydrogenase family)